MKFLRHQANWSIYLIQHLMSPKMDNRDQWHHEKIRAMQVLPIYFDPSSEFLMKEVEEFRLAKIEADYQIDQCE